MSRVKKSENSWKFPIIAPPPPPRENKEMFLAKGGQLLGQFGYANFFTILGRKKKKNFLRSKKKKKKKKKEKNLFLKINIWIYKLNFLSRYIYYFIFKDILQFFPVFAISLQKWAPHIRLSRGWDKIRHAIRLCQSLGQIGMYESFTQMLQDINGVKSDQGGHNINSEQTKKAAAQGYKKFKKSIASAQHFFT